MFRGADCKHVRRRVRGPLEPDTGAVQLSQHHQRYHRPPPAPRDPSLPAPGPAGAGADRPPAVLHLTPASPTSQPAHRSQQAGQSTGLDTGKVPYLAGQPAGLDTGKV